jgi:hypothetical protein
MKGRPKPHPPARFLQKMPKVNPVWLMASWPWLWSWDYTEANTSSEVGP